MRLICTNNNIHMYITCKNNNALYTSNIHVHVSTVHVVQLAISIVTV